MMSMGLARWVGGASRTGRIDGEEKVYEGWPWPAMQSALLIEVDGDICMARSITHMHGRAGALFCSCSCLPLVRLCAELS